MRNLSIAAVAAAMLMCGFAPQLTPPRTPDCGDSSTRPSQAFLDGYAKATQAISGRHLEEAINLANGLEPVAANDRQRSNLSSVRQTAYAGLKDDRGVLLETEKQIDLGCLSPQQLKMQTEMAQFMRKDLGLPPR